MPNDQPSLFGIETEAPFTSPLARDTPALADLTEETLDAITGDITEEQARTLVWMLSTQEARHADDVLNEYLRRDYPWFPSASKRDTQKRFIRRLIDGAVALGHPVCSTNTGYILGDREMVRQAADRCRALARGSLRRALQYDRVADHMAEEEEQ